MADKKSGLVKADEADKKSVQELLEIRKEHEQETTSEEHRIQEALKDEFHQVWEETIKPALEQLKGTTEELLKHFSEFEDDFRGYLRDKEPDVNVDLLEEIYGDTLRASSDKQSSKDKRNNSTS